MFFKSLLILSVISHCLTAGPARGDQGQAPVPVATAPSKTSMPGSVPAVAASPTSTPEAGATPPALSRSTTKTTIIGAKAGKEAKERKKKRAKAVKLEMADEKSATKLETFHDLITKAENLTLQRDRLQASQVLIRGLRRESRGSVAYKELAKTLDDLSTVFYTEKAQGLFSSAESAADIQPKDAIEPLQQALRLEDSNLTLLKALARMYLKLGECDKADSTTVAAETINPFSAEVRLLKLQTLNCQKNFDALNTALNESEEELRPVSTFLFGFEVADALRQKTYREAKRILSAWESESPSYPEIYYWKWQLSELLPPADRAAAIRYTQLCQALTPRRRKSFNLDVDLCKGKDAADLFIKESSQSTIPTATPPK